MICDLGGGKGKVTRHFFLQGLKKADDCRKRI